MGETDSFGTCSIKDVNAKAILLEKADGPETLEINAHKDTEIYTVNLPDGNT